MNMYFTERITRIADNHWISVLRNHKILNQLGMPSPNRSASFEVEVRCEQNFNMSGLLSYVQLSNHKLTFEQKNIYDQIIQTVNNRAGEIYILHAPGGTGKMFLAII